MKPSLDDIGLRHKTDKSSDHHDYLRLYEKRLSHLKGQRFALFEIGVYKGASLATWAEFFPSAIVVGLDIDQNCALFAEGNAFVRIGDQSDPVFLSRVLAEFGRPQVVIDDGSHRWDHQIAALQMLYPQLTGGGLYIMEDIDTSFPGYAQSYDYDFKAGATISTFDYIHQLNRHLVGDWAETSQPYDLFVANYFKSIESIEYARRTCIITKRP